MEHFLSRSLHASVVLLEVLALVWIGKKATELAASARFDRELLTRDNPAAGIALAGFYLALFTALSGLLGGEPASLGRDALLVALHGGGAILVLIVCPALWRPIVQVDFRKDILEARNTGAALVAASALVATGLIYRGAVHGEGGDPASVAAFFWIGEGALLLVIILYEWMTPYDVYAEITERANAAAALASAGAILASGLIIGNAVEGEFVAWKESIADALLYLLPLLALPVVRVAVVNGILLGGGNVNREIQEDRNLAAGLVEGAAYVGMALFVVHLLT